MSKHIQDWMAEQTMECHICGAQRPFAPHDDKCAVRSDLKVVYISRDEKAMELERGTPKYLSRAIEEGFLTDGLMELKIYDFLSQHFTYIICKHPEAEKAVQELFVRVTRRSK